jgi:hypothetical protein
MHRLRLPIPNNESADHSIMIFIDASIEGQPPGYVRAIASKKNSRRDFHFRVSNVKYWPRASKA